MEQMYIHEKLLEEQWQYYEYTRKERKVIVGRRVKSSANVKAKNWIGKAVDKHQHRSNRKIDGRETNH